MIGPNPKIEGHIQRKLASLLSAFHLAVIPFIVLTVLFGDLVINVGLLLIGVIIGSLALYSFSRTQYYRVSVTITIFVYTFVPLLIWFLATSWQASDIPRIMPWIIVALALGSFFTNEKVVILQGIVISIILLIVAGFIQGITFSELDTHMLTVVILCLIVIVFSRLTSSYLSEIEKQSIELDKQKRDLEIYTRLLRHDLSNDLQAIINSVELSQLLLPVNLQNVNENLEQSLNFSIRMQKLLQVFRLPPEQPGTNLIEEIRKIALESEQIHGNITIEVSSTSAAEKESITANRLLSLVWTNIFRNASQHAGEHPAVQVNISIDALGYIVTIRDNGPGISPEKRANLFKKGMELEQRDKGVGLYLSKLIIESHGGSMELADSPETEFIIRLPVSSSK